MPTGGYVVISYRREDTSAHAGRLFDLLTVQLGRGHVFMDVDSIEPGADFVEAIRQAVGTATVLIAVIGPQWLTAKSARNQRRIDDKYDYVRLEVETALQRNIRVIPILVDGAEMPQPDDLPEALRLLTRRNAVRIDSETFRTDVIPLVDTVTNALIKKASPRSESTKASGPDSSRVRSESSPDSAAVKIADTWSATLLERSTSRASLRLTLTSETHYISIYERAAFDAVEIDGKIARKVTSGFNTLSKLLKGTFQLSDGDLTRSLSISAKHKGLTSFESLQLVVDDQTLYSE